MGSGKTWNPIKIPFVNSKFKIEHIPTNHVRRRSGVDYGDEINYFRERENKIIGNCRKQVRMFKLYVGWVDDSTD